MITVLTTSTSQEQGISLYIAMLKAWDSIPTTPEEPIRIFLDLTLLETAQTHISEAGYLQGKDLAPVLRDIGRVTDIDDQVLILCKQNDPASSSDIQMSGLFSAILSITNNVHVIHHDSIDYIVSQGVAAIFEAAMENSVKS